MLLAKGVFIVCTYAAFLLLPRLLGSAAEFGRFAAVMALVGMLANVIVATLMQSVSRSAARASNAPGAQRDVRHQAAWRLGLPTLLFSGLLAVLAAPIASGLQDSSLTTLLRWGGLGLGAYGLHAIGVGSLNGRKAFKHQALVDMTLSALRLAAFVVGAVTLGTAEGPLIGFGLVVAIAAFLSWTLAWRRDGAPEICRPSDQGEGNSIAPPPRVPFAGALLLFHLGVGALLQADIVLMKARVSYLLGPSTGAALSSELAAFYRAAQSFAFVPYQLAVPVAMSAFPVLASRDNKDRHEVSATVLRFAWLGVACLGASIAAAAPQLLAAVFPPAYAEAADALTLLAPALALVALFVVGATMVNALGAPLASFGCTVAGLCAGGATLWILLDGHLASAVVLERTAIATCVAGGVSLVALLGLMARVHQCRVPLRSAICGGLGATAACLAGRAWATYVPTRIALIDAALAMGLTVALYLAILLATREVPWATVRAALNRLGPNRRGPN